jgi:hypothetical protein
MSRRVDPPARKNAVIQEISQARGEILAAVGQLAPQQMDVKYLGSWSLKDLLAHLNVWYETNLRALSELRQSRLPGFYDHIDPDWRSFNAMLVERHRLEDPRLLVDRLVQSHTRLLEAITALDPSDLDRDWGVRYKGYRVTIARLLSAEVKDEREHARQIRDAFGLF